MADNSDEQHHEHQQEQQQTENDDLLFNDNDDEQFNKINENNICENDPNFSVITSYLLQFGQYLSINFSIGDFKEMLENTDKISEELIDLHIKLLRKRRKYINRDKWEKALVKFISEYSHVDAWELERYGYKHIKLSIRIDVIKRLLEAQFDFNTKFKSEVNALEASSLRLLPIGRDVKGYQYWFQLDESVNLRIYREFPDEDNSWSLICNDKDGLMKLINDLQLNNNNNNNNAIKEESSATVSENDDSNLEKKVIIKKETEDIDNEEEDNTENNIEIKIEKEEEEEEEDNKNELKCKIKQEETFDDNLVNKIEHNECDEKSDLNFETNENETIKGENKLNIICKEEKINEEELIAKNVIELNEGKSELSSSNNLDNLHISNDQLSNLNDLEKDLKCTMKPFVNEKEIFEEKNYEEILNSINDIINQIELEEKLFNDHEKDEFFNISIKQTCDYLIDTVVNEENLESNDQINKEVVYRGRGRGGRGRGVSQNTKRGRGRSSRGSRNTIDGLIIETNIIIENEIAPVKRSRRIQALQEKKNAEMAEMMKKEQERLEELARKRNEKEQKRIQEIQAFKNKRQVESESEAEIEQESDSESSGEEFVYKKGKKTKRKKRKGKKEKINGCPWDSNNSGTEDEASVHESEYEEEEEEEELKFEDHEDEFACEEIEPDAEPIVMKRARTVKKIRSDSEDNSETEENDDTPCRKCEKYDHPEWILLCDICDNGYHTACLKPPLMLIPEGDWFCPVCENKSLLMRLEEEYKELEKLWEKREREELRKQRLKFVEINMNNILNKKPNNENSLTNKKSKINSDEEELSNEENVNIKPRKDKKRRARSDDEEEEEEEEDDEEDSSEEEDDSYFHLRSARSKKINYKFTEFDELINSAIRDDNEYDEDGYVYTKEEENANILDKNEENVIFSENTTINVTTENIPSKLLENDQLLLVKDKIESNEEVKGSSLANEDNDGNESEESSHSIKKVNRGRGTVKKRRLNDLDSPPEDDDDDESFKGTSDTEIDDATEEEEDDNTISEDEESEDSNFKSRRRYSSRSVSSKRNRNQKGGKNCKNKRKGYRRDEFVVDSDDSDIGFSSRGGGGGAGRVKTRAAAKKKVSYREISSDETEEEQSWCWKSSKSSKKRKDESETSDEEWCSDSDTKSKTKKTKFKISDDEEEEEDEDNDDVENEEDDDEQEEEEEKDDESEDTDQEQVKMTKVKPVKEKVEMRGKPRLSKARLMSLREDDSGDESKSNFKNKQKSQKEEEEIVKEKDNEEDKVNKSNNNNNEFTHNKEKETVKRMEEIVTDNQNIDERLSDIATKNSELKTNVIMCQNSSLSDISKNIQQDTLPNTITSTTSQMIKTNDQSALSQLTAFASRGPITSAPSPLSQPVITTYNNYSPTQPPPLMPTSTERVDDDSYSITSLDNYSNRQKPLKPSLITNDPYQQPPSSPSRLLNLESNNRPVPLNPSIMNRFHILPPGAPQTIHNLDVKQDQTNGIRIRGHHQQNYPRGQQSYPNPTLPPQQLPPPPPPQGPDYGPRSFYDPRVLPRNQMPANMHHLQPPSRLAFPRNPQTPHFHHNPPSTSSTTSPGNFYHHSHQQASFYPPQANDFRARVPSTTNSTHPAYAHQQAHSLPPHPSHSLPSHLHPPPTVPQGIPSGHYAAYYSHSSGLNVNGGFMIQNLLQERATEANSLTTGVVGNAAVEEDELRSVTDIVTFITQE